MADVTTATQAEEVVETENTVATRETGELITLTTEAGPVHVINSNMASAQMLGIMNHFLDTYGGAGHGLWTIMFRDDGYPRVKGMDTIWAFTKDAKAAICNIPQCVKSAFVHSLDDDRARHVSVRTLVWLNLMQGFFHEVHHAERFIDDRKLIETDEDAQKEEEVLADEHARATTIELCKSINMEPEFPEAIEEWIDFYWTDTANYIKWNYDAVEAGEKVDVSKEQVESDIEWLKLQTMMAENDWAFYSPAQEIGGDAVYFPTFKEYMQFACGADPGDEEWGGNVLGVALNLVQEEVPAPAEATTVDTTTTVSETPVIVVPPVGEETVEAEEMPWEDDEYAGMPEGAPYIPGMQGVQQQVERSAQVAQPAVQCQAQTVATCNIPADQLPKAPEMGVNPAAVVPGQNTHAPNQMAEQDMASIMKGLYLKLFNFIFTECGFNGTAYTNGAKIVTPVMLTAAENTVVQTMATYDASGNVNMNRPVDGWVSGLFMDGKNTLPGYNLRLKTPSGHQIIRKLVPQNPNKIGKGGQLTSTAAKARQGHQIVWILDPDAADKQFSLRVWNGVLQSNNNGAWIDV